MERASLVFVCCAIALVVAVMADVAIELSGISKSYPRGGAVAEKKKGGFFGRGASSNAPVEEISVLKGVSLEVPRGSVWGIVGRNGAGKSMLTEIIAGNVPPTSGSMSVRGRVMRVSAVNAELKPELTGRANVAEAGRRLAGAQGWSEAQVGEVLLIAEVGAAGDFAELPVARYSAGLRAQLAFTIAVAAGPQVLIVDEWGALGEEFAASAMTQIRAMQKAGATVLLLSPSAVQVAELCDGAVLLDAGEILAKGTGKEVAPQYRRWLSAKAMERARVRQEIREGKLPSSSQPAKASEMPESLDPQLMSQTMMSYPSRGAMIHSARIEGQDGKRLNVLNGRGAYVYVFDVSFERPAQRVRATMLLKTVNGLELGGACSHIAAKAIPAVGTGQTLRVAFRFECNLQPGSYLLNAGVLAADDAAGGGGGEIFLHRVVDAVLFRVQPTTESTATAIVDFKVVPTVEGADAGAIASSKETLHVVR